MRRYYLPSKSSLIKRAYRYLFKKEMPLPSFPEMIQIQTMSGCNASCLFCPSGKTYKPLGHGVMEEGLFEKIIEECVGHHSRRISPFLMNEPLLDRKLPEKIKFIDERRQRGKTHIRISTNASLLDERMASALIESGLDRLHISFQGITQETYEASMPGLNFQKTLENIERFLILKEKEKASKPLVKMTMVATNEVEKEIEQSRLFWAQKGLKSEVFAMGSRASTSIAQSGLNPKPWRPFSWCQRLMRQAYILYNGDVVLCCCDWERSTILGNLKDSSLKEIWQGPRYAEVRRRYARGDLEGLPCQNCYITKEPKDFKYE